MVYYDVDGHYIDDEQMKDHNEKSMIKAYQALMACTTRNCKTKPKLHILDNKASVAFKAEIQKKCELRLIMPDTHCLNLAERTFQTFKSHLILILAGVDPKFPMSLWDRLLPQAVLTLNLQRQANATPTVSAYQYVNGEFDYNKMPLAPLGSAIQMHESTNRCKTWDAHSLNGWYLGTLTKHYWCHIIFCQKTCSKRISDIVFFQHRYITQPAVTPKDHIVKAVGDLASALQHWTNVQGREEMEALQRLNNILNNIKSREVEKKQVTFKDPIPEPRVGRSGGDIQQSPKTQDSASSKAGY
jgi:hypothetical protein